MRLQITWPEAGGEVTDVLTPAPWPAHPAPCRTPCKAQGLRDRDQVERVAIMPCGSCQGGKIPVTTVCDHWD